MADRFDVQIEAFIPARNVSGYVADIHGLLIFNFAQELQRQVYRLGIHPFCVAFLNISFALQLVLQVGQGFSDLLVDIYCYKAPHVTLDTLKLCNVS
jgi:hypothetical protein